MSDPFAVRALLGPAAVLCRRALTGESGVALPPLIDHHVHLHLIDEHGLAAGGIAGVVDLGGDPVALARRDPHAVPHVAFAGAFLTAPGGYPTGRGWAPPAIAREIVSASRHPGAPGGAGTAVDEQASFGASVIKVAVNADAGPVLAPDVLEAVVAHAHSRQLPVVAHVQGPGMLHAAVTAGVDVLAHAPFSEPLDDDSIQASVDAGQRWISTLDIHRGDPTSGEIAIANLAAFATAGGRVLYGTDLGNGDLPTGVNARELAALHRAGVSGAALIDTMIDPWPLPASPAGLATFVAGPPPASDSDIATWLTGAAIVPLEELLHDD